MILLCRYLDNWRVLVWLVEVLYADYLWYLALGIDGEAYGLQALQLHLKKTFNHVVLPNRRDLDCHFDLSTFFLSDLETDLFEVLEAFITAYRKDVLI